MTRQNKLLLFSILLISLVQMPGQATAPAINKIYTEVFTDHSLSAIQSVFSITSITAGLGSIPVAFMIRRGLISKRAAVAFGMFLLGSVGVLSIFLHSYFWHFVLLCTLIGIAAASFISPYISVLVDSFRGEERKCAAGLQSTFLGVGGVLLSITGGYLVNFRWFGPYLILLIALPIGALVLFTFPKGKIKPAAADKSQPLKKARLNPDIYYYAAFLCLNMFLFIVGSNNISTHLANSGIENYSAAAGYATAFQMAGSVASGALFKKLTNRFGDMMLALALFMIFIGYTLINLLNFSLFFIYLGIFLSGSSVSIITPQCILSVSKRVDETSSATAASIVNSVAPGVGCFLSPIIITNLTSALGGSSTNYRFQFAAFVALSLAVLVFVLNKYREKKQAGISS